MASGPALLQAVLARVKAAEEQLPASRCTPSLIPQSFKQEFAHLTSVKEQVTKLTGGSHTGSSLHL